MDGALFAAECGKLRGVGRLLDFGDGVEERADVGTGAVGGLGRGEAGGGWHELEVAGGGDGNRGGVVALGDVIGVGGAGGLGGGLGGFGGGEVGVLGLGVGDAGERGNGGGGLHGGDFLFALGLLDLAELLFHLHFEFVGSTAELADPFSEFTGEHRQLLRPEQEKSEDKDNNAVGQTGHIPFDDTAYKVAVTNQAGMDGLERLGVSWRNASGSEVKFPCGRIRRKLRQSDLPERCRGDDEAC